MAKYMKYFHLCKVWEIFSRLSDCQLVYVILLEKEIIVIDY